MPAFLDEFPEVTVDLTVRDHLIDPVAEAVDVVLRLGDLRDSGMIANLLHWWTVGVSIRTRLFPADGEETLGHAGIENLRPPAHIIEAGVPFTEPDYVWTSETDDDILLPQPAISGRIAEMSDRAALAFALGAIEWTFWRLHEMLPDDGVFQFLDAAWAGLVDWRYLDAFIDRPWEETFDREIGSPIEAAISRLELAFASARDGMAFFDQPVTISEVALRVCGVPEAFEAWRRATLVRLIQVSPADPAVGLGRPLPRDIVAPAYTSSPAQDDERIAVYLASLDWRNNPYLGKPDEMKANGFDGDPYQWPPG